MIRSINIGEVRRPGAPRRLRNGAFFRAAVTLLYSVVSVELGLGVSLGQTSNSADRPDFDSITLSDAHYSAASILALDPEKARQATPVTLKGVVTGSTDLGFTVQDATAGIWIYWDHPESIASGDYVEISGTTDPCRFSPCIRAGSVKKLGRAPLPHPTPANFHELSTGNLDSQYVSVTGVVRSAGLRPNASPSQSVSLKIALADGDINVTLPRENIERAGELVDATVRVTAPAMCTKNQDRQITSPTLTAGGMSVITILHAAPSHPFDISLTPISSLLQYRSGTDYYHRVRVRGVVTYYRPGDRLVLEDQERALLVLSPQVSDIRLGDRVEALGFPAAEDSGPYLQDAVLRDISTGTPQQPTPVRMDEVTSGTHRYDLVTTQGYLLRRVDEPQSIILVLQSGATLLLAEFYRSPGTSNLQNLKEGSTVQVSGISMLDVEGTWNYGPPSATAVRYKLLLRSPEDVRVLKPPSWWTITHVLYIAGVLALLMIAFLFLDILNRMERWKLQAVLQERERLAHEMHDTLAQSFAGIGFQMQAIRRAIPDGLPHLQQQVELATDLVRHSHKEARRSVEPAEPESEEDVELLASLETTARKMVEGAVVVSAATIGDERDLPPFLATQLLRIGQEAIANAVRHADPHHLDILLAYRENYVRLTITDDGNGFVKSGDLLGFGLRGMRRRAASISADLDILSEPDKGTRVTVTAPLPPDMPLIAFIKRNISHLIRKPKTC